MPPLGLEHRLISEYAPGEVIAVKALVRDGADRVAFYYRTAGLKDFQVRLLTRRDDGAYALAFDTSSLPVTVFDYYLEARQGDRSVSVPATAPDEPHRVLGSGGEEVPAVPADLPAPQAEEARFAFPLSASGSGLAVLARNEPRPGIVDPRADGNVRVSVISPQERGFGLAVDANFALTNAPPSGQQGLELSNMSVSVTRGAQTLRAGDLNLNESDYTVFGLGRRGVELAHEGRGFFLRLFDVGTQQVRGFRGLGFPPAGLNIFGGAAGARFFKDAVLVKAIYVSGRDDPSRAANAVASPFYTPRRGDVAALVEETRLFSGKLGLTAEYARARYDADTRDDADRVADDAVRLGADVSMGDFSASARFRRVGRDFNSIGLPYLSADRRGLEANAGYAKGKLNLQGSVLVERDNIADDLDRGTTESLNGRLTAMYTLSGKVTLNAGWGMNNQTTIPGTETFFVRDARARDLSLGLSWMPSAAAAFNFGAARSTLTSPADPALKTSSLMLSAGGSIRRGETLTVNPSLSLTRTDTPAAGRAATSWSANVASEIFVVPRLVSLGLVGAAGRMRYPGLEASTILDLTAAAGCHLGNIIRWKTILVSLNGSVRRMGLTGREITDSRLFLQCDFAF